VSYATPKPDYAKISGLTFSTMSEQDRMESRKTWNSKDLWLSILLIAAIIAVYLYFTG
jgi:SSS family solute:Na+ symporter